MALTGGDDGDPRPEGLARVSSDRHVYTMLADTPRRSFSVVGWEPGQISPIHSHRDADEIYHVNQGEGLSSMTVAGRCGWDRETP
jgi:quercetin dioxygenase-like cupin family protein